MQFITTLLHFMLDYEMMADLEKDWLSKSYNFVPRDYMQEGGLSVLWPEEASPKT